MNSTQVLQPEFPGGQCLWQLDLRCIHHLGNYWARQIPSTLTQSFCQEVDVAIQDVILLAIEVDLVMLSNTAKERMRLPVRTKGCGLRRLEDRGHTEYIRGVLQVVPPLLTSVDVNNIILNESLDTLGMWEWLVDDSFNGNSNIEPWEALAGHGNTSPIYQDLEASWGHIQENIAGIFKELG